MKKLAICVPTYNRPDIVEELFAMSLTCYIRLGVDLFIYDSSESDETEKIVKRYMETNSNLFYVRMDSFVHSNLKVYRIFQEFQKNGIYQYVWICADAIRWASDTMESVMPILENNYDFVVVNYRDVEKIGTREYRDKNEFFRDCAWHMTWYGATIVRIGTVLKDVDWQYLEEKYCIPERINHSHVAMYFEQLAKMESFCAYHYSVAIEKLTPSPLRKASGWHRDTFRVWCTYWPNMINALPDSYLYKKEVIKKEGINSTILQEDFLTRLRIDGIYHFGIFIEYLFRWKHLTDMPLWKLFLITVLPKKYLANKTEWMIKKSKKKLKRFCTRFSYIYFYGCGQKADRFSGYLDEMKIQYEGFIISSMPQKGKKFKGKPILEFSEDLLNREGIGIIVALNEENTKEIIEKFPVLCDKKNVFSEYT